MMKRVLWGGLLLLLCLAAPGASEVVLPAVGTVLGTRVNMRAEPSTSASVLLRFSGGELVEVLEKAPEKSGDQYPWYRVTMNDSTGWVYGQYLAVDKALPRFALASLDGSKVLLLQRPLMETIAPRFTRCIFNGVLHSVTFEDYRTESQKWNGRETARTFDDLAGFLFRVEGKPLSLPYGDPVGSDVLLVDDEYTGSVEPIPLKKSPAEATPDQRKAFEKRYGRTLKAIVRIAEAEDSGVAVYAMEFKPKGKNALAAIALVAPEGTFCLDFPAAYDEQSTWHVDDGGEFYPESYIVGSLLKRGDGYEFTLHDASAESFTSRLVVTTGGKLVESPVTSSARYIVPE
ncbi:MAG TPA: hypothetical protein DIC53_04405 [Synergistaceae bacterium]|nr:hypothetical protein [Synergistaceae bacterium]